MEHFVEELKWLRERFAELAESQQHDRGTTGSEQAMHDEIYRANDVLYALINCFSTLSQIAKK